MKREREIGSVKISSKYQIVIPEAVRKIEGILTGDDIAFVQNSFDEIVIRNKSKLEVSTIENVEEEKFHQIISETFHSTDAKVILAVLDFSTEERGITTLRKYIQLSQLNMEIISSIRKDNEQLFLLQDGKLENTILRNQRINELPEAYLLPYNFIEREEEDMGFSYDVHLKLKNEVLGKAPLIIIVRSNEFGGKTDYENFILQSFKFNCLKLEDFAVLNFTTGEKYDVIEGKIIK